MGGKHMKNVEEIYTLAYEEEEDDDWGDDDLDDDDSDDGDDLGDED